MVKQTATKKNPPKKSGVPEVLAELEEIIDDLADETIEQEFSFEATPEGEYGARLVECIELGKHAKIFDGKASKPVPTVRLTFELLDAELAYESEGADGVKRTKYPLQSVEVTKGSSSKSNYIKFLKAFKNAVPELSDAKQLVAFVNKPIVLKIVHTAGKKDPSKVFINLKADHISSVVYKDKKTKKLETIEVPDATATFRILLWDHPTVVQWNTLFIDGTREKDGETISKNWLQNRVLKATNFNGSALADILEGAGLLDGIDADILDAEDYVNEDVVEDDTEDEIIDEDILDGDFLEDSEEILEDEEIVEEVEEEEEVVEEEVEETPPVKKSAAKTVVRPSVKAKAPVATSAKPVLTKTTSPSKPVVRTRAAALAKDIGLKK